MRYPRFAAKIPHFLDCVCQCGEKRQRLQRALAGRLRPNDLPVGISQTTRSFHVTGKVPWSTTKASHEVEYLEFQGHGPPSFFGDEFGDVGDIYIDLTPGKHCIYARVSKAGWAIWPGPLFVLNDVRHPTYPNYRLWCKMGVQSSNIGWHAHSNGVVADYKLSAHEIIKKALEMRETRSDAQAPTKPAKRPGRLGKRKIRRSEILQQSKKAKMESTAEEIEDPSCQNAPHVSASDDAVVEPPEGKEYSNISNECATVGSESSDSILATDNSKQYENSASESCAKVNTGPTIVIPTIYKDTPDTPQHRLPDILQTDLTTESTDGSLESTESTSKALRDPSSEVMNKADVEPLLSAASSTSGSSDRPTESPIEATSNFEDNLDGVMSCNPSVAVSLEDASVLSEMTTAVDSRPNSPALDDTHQEITCNGLASLSPTSSPRPAVLNPSLAPSITEESRNEIESTEAQWMPSISDEPNVILLTPARDVLTSSERPAEDEVTEESAIVREYDEKVARFPPDSDQNIAVVQVHSDSDKSPGDPSERDLAEPRINERVDEAVAPKPSGPSKAQLKDVHLSILFVKYSGRMLCRICLANNARIFEFKPNTSHDTLAMLEHCLCEHAEDCEALVTMSEKDLQELVGKINAGVS